MLGLFQNLLSFGSFRQSALLDMLYIVNIMF